MGTGARRGLFYERLTSRIEALGGLHNAHLHLDRSGTLDEAYLAPARHRVLESSHISLQEKHGLIETLHSGPAYDPDDLRRRVHGFLDVMVEAGTTRADTLVDVTADEVGTRALEVLLEIKRARASEIDLRLAAYSPFGFIDAEPERWEILERGAAHADFLASLPEADDTSRYPCHIGFDEHLVRMLELARRLRLPLHVHTDQRNEPGEDATERLVAAVRAHGAAEPRSGEPMVWAVHVISPSTYEEPRFRRLVEGMVECDIGVVCCPSAALGMRQLRPLATPTYNSIARVLELLDAGVRVRLGSDNIADICSPSTTADLIDEVFVLSAALRFYHVDVLAKLACGLPLDGEERAVVREHLACNEAQIQEALGATAALNGRPGGTGVP